MTGVQINVYGQAESSPADPCPALARRYLKALRQEVVALPLAALEEEAADSRRPNVTLDRVYIALDTQSNVPLTEAEKKKAEDQFRSQDERPLSALEAAAQNERLVLLGDPGSGKSVFANHWDDRRGKANRHSRRPAGPVRPGWNQVDWNQEFAWDLPGLYNPLTLPFEGTDGLDIHYLAGEPESADQGPTFVLLHGSLFNAFTWNEVIGFFSERGRVVAYDQIPYGLSEKLVARDWTERNPYRSEAAVDQLFLLLDALGVDKVILVGNSYGGTLAVQATLAHPERVEALVLVDAAVYVQEELPAWLLELPQVRRLGPLFTRKLKIGMSPCGHICVPGEWIHQIS